MVVFVCTNDRWRPTKRKDKKATQTEIICIESYDLKRKQPSIGNWRNLSGSHHPLVGYTFEHANSICAIIFLHMCFLFCPHCAFLSFSLSNSRLPHLSFYLPLLLLIHCISEWSISSRAISNVMWLYALEANHCRRLLSCFKKCFLLESCMRFCAS